MDYILAILIACSAGYALGYNLGVRRGRKESRMTEYRNGYREGYDRARKDLSDLFRLDDEDLLVRIRELRKSAGK